MTYPSSRRIQRFQTLMGEWFMRHKRDLPWRRTHDPYAILVSEIMLQQTQVERVIPKYHAWLKRFPTVSALARASARDILLEWEGMGYNRRALYLKRAAEDVEKRFQGKVPTTPDILQTLPGIGPYTAGAVATFASKIPYPFVDTNVNRVLLRLFVGARTTAEQRHPRFLLQLAEHVMPRKKIGSIPPYMWGHMLMDVGSAVCKSTPRCEVCPLKKMCKAYPEIKTHGVQKVVKPFENRTHVHPDRIYRGRIVQCVREAHPKPFPRNLLGPTVLPGYKKKDSVWLEKLLARLEKDGMVHLTKTTISLPRA